MGIPDPQEKRRHEGRTPQPKHEIANYCCYLVNTNQRFRLLLNNMSPCFIFATRIEKKLQVEYLDISLLLPVEATAVLFSASSLSFFSVNMITHEPLHPAWWNSAWTRLATSRSLLNIKVIGQRSRSREFLCLFVSMILLEPVGLDSRNVAQAWPASST